jgi:transcriptional regulator with XRE-family HTH domain
MASGTGHGGTDLGRRIAEQRGRAGLSRAEAAQRAGMSAEYLSYLETSATPNPSRGALARLAAALGAPPAALTGAGLDQPPGQHEPAGQPVLQALSKAECRDYLGAGGVGRFLFVDARGPVALPVNYRMHGDDIVFRTGGDSSLAAAATGQRRVSFDVDHLDDALGEGWSVLVSGTASQVTDPAELDQVRALGIAPWAGGGGRETYIRVVPSQITGRRIRITG